MTEGAETVEAVADVNGLRARAREILLVDDDALVGRTVRRMLPPDVTLRCATSKARGVALLRDASTRWLAVLIDMQLGDERFAGLDVLDVALATESDKKNREMLLSRHGVEGPSDHARRLRTRSARHPETVLERRPAEGDSESATARSTR